MTEDFETTDRVSLVARIMELEARLAALLSHGDSQASADLAELKAARQILEDRLHRCEDLYDFAPIACVTMDGFGLIREMNLTAATLLGLPRAHAARTPFLRFVAPESRTEFLNHLIRCRTSGGHVVEVQLACKTGQKIQAQLHTRAYGDGDARLFPTAITDLTDLRATEAERARLATANQQAQTSGEAKDRFLAILSHELRTPLTPVLAALTASDFERDLPPHLLPTVEMIRRNIRHEARLIDDLLDVNRIIRQKLELRKSVISLHSVLRETTEACADELSRRGLSLTEDFSAAEHFAQADSGRLRQVFLNLLNNAMKFTPAGGNITVSTRRSGEGKITIEVTDTGTGIAPDAIGRLFEPFEQVGPRLEAASAGLGLGLSIAKGLVEAHGGRITASSAGVGKGATFEVTLPTVPAEKLAQLPAPQAQHHRPLKILLVEDHSDTARVMATLLRKHGHEVRVAMSVHEAKHMADEKFDLLVSDIGLPDGSGADVMRAVSERQNVPGIALSGLASAEDIRASKESGFTEHLTKPVDFPVLLSAIDVVAGRVSSTRPN
ncbi:MAG TPA: ATP-binding protein [Humisphaera sp.]|nr:ATP-binding protein [Humisphaera sp.]